MTFPIVSPFGSVRPDGIVKMKCPHCEATFTMPKKKKENGVYVLICPVCGEKLFSDQ